jgi:hypothetical protein
MSEDCTRCDASLDWLLKHGCPMPGSIWCLWRALGKVPHKPAGEKK